MPIVTACHLEIDSEIKHEYILGVEIRKKITGPVFEVTELATLHTFKVMFGDYVSGTYPKENMNRYTFLSYIICQFFSPSTSREGIWIPHPVWTLWRREKHL